MENEFRKVVRGYWAVFASALAVYVFTCGRGALWQDSGMYLYRIWHNDFEGGLGLALSHPLYHLVGMAVKQIPFGEFGFKINLISAVCGAFTVANVFLFLRLLTGSLFPGIVGAISLGVSWTFWQHSVMAEDYVMYTAFLTAELVFLLRYFQTGKNSKLYWVGLLNGLSIAVHMLGIIPLACYVLLAAFLLFKKHITFRSLGIILLFWVVGALPYEFLVIRRMIVSGDIAGTIMSALFGNSWAGDVLNVSMSMRIVKENILFIGLSFPTLNIFLFLAALFGLHKSVKDKCLLYFLYGLLALFFVFAFRYTVPDRYAFFIPFYCMVSIFLGIGAHMQYTMLGKRKIIAGTAIFMALVPIAVYIIVPVIAERKGISIGTSRTIPYRNDYAHFLSPWKSFDRSAELFAADALGSIEENAVIIADGTTVYSLWYGQDIKGLGAEVSILSNHGSYNNPIEFPTEDTILNLMANRPVYVVTPQKGYCPQFILDKFDFAETGPIYKVMAR